MTENTVKLKNKTPFWIGDHFYKVECNTNKNNRDTTTEFATICPSCDDLRKIKYIGHDGKEYEAECPVCKKFSPYKTGYGNRITICNWEIHEYIVHQIRAQGPTTISAYKDGIGYLDSVSLYAFHRLGRCMDDYIESIVPSFKDYIDPKIESIELERIGSKDYVFRDKKDAEKLCEMLKEYDRKRLEEFNKTYNTCHEYPY